MNDDNKYKIPVTLTTLINVPMIANTRMAPLKMDEFTDEIDVKVIVQMFCGILRE